MRFLFIFFLIISLPAFALSECKERLPRLSSTEFQNLETNLITMGEVKAKDLDWQNGDKIPKEISTYLTKHNPISINQFTFFDLNNDGRDEVIIRSVSLGGSGGEGFMFLEKKNGAWAELINFTGGFILSKLDVPKSYNQKYYTITQWRRFGNADTIQSFLAYKNHKYHFVSEQPVPLTVLYSKDFQKMLLDINWMCWATWN